MKFGFADRRITRREWRALHRQLRIINRETALADADRVTFGTGMIRIGPGVPDFIARVHPSNSDARLFPGGER